MIQSLIVRDLSVAIAVVYQIISTWVSLNAIAVTDGDQLFFLVI
jgi:hypothetical protein